LVKVCSQELRALMELIDIGEQNEYGFKACPNRPTLLGVSLNIG